MQSLKLSPHTRTRLLYRNGKKVRAHRWIMEQHIGRKLLPEEHVHHKDGNPLNNDINNLEIIDHKSHMVIHKQKYPNKKTCENCCKEYIANPRRRKRQKCCSKECAQNMRIEGRKRQVKRSTTGSGADRQIYYEGALWMNFGKHLFNVSWT